MNERGAIVAAKYLFRFGYCTPEQWDANEAHGWDDESSSAIYIVAASEDEALAWGREVANRFVGNLFSASGKALTTSWVEAGFAHWIDDAPMSSFREEQLRQLLVVRVGELPDFRIMR
jgi:hypothetical protein